MLRRLFRGGTRGNPIGAIWLRLTRLSRRSRAALLVLAFAAFVEVWVHTQEYAVRQPPRELDPPFYTECQEPDVDGPRENAALVMLARNTEAFKAVKTVQSIERHFNRWFHYPIVFLNDEPWSDDFMSTMKETASGEVRFEVIPKQDWAFRTGMNVRKAKESIAAQGRAGILYAGLETYHHMCRFYSGWVLCLSPADPPALCRAVASNSGRAD